jgi:hypothetical protein
MRNPFVELLSLIPTAPLQVGEVVAAADGVATIELPDGAQVQARGEAVIGDRVFFRDGVIEGPAPTLPVELIDV